jgi:cyanophycinase
VNLCAFVPLWLFFGPDKAIAPKLEILYNIPMRKTSILFILSIIFFSSVILFAGQEAKGGLVIIGGALNENNKAVYDKFSQLGGGKENIRIAIIPAATETPAKTGQYYVHDFARFGIPENRITVFPLAVKDDPSTKEVDESQWSKNGSNKELAEKMRQYTAVFFVGGDQARYRETLIDAQGNDLPLLAAIREVYDKGGVLAGTSAGAAIMSDPMFIDGNPVEAINGGVLYQLCPSGTAPKKKAWLSKGLGFFKGGIIDQHFLKRGRLGRLIPMLMYCREQKKHTLGFGVDEDTALVCQGNTVEVLGSSGVLIVDVAKTVVKDTPYGPKGENVILHYLEAGDSFNLETGRFSIDAGRKPIEKGKEYYETYSLDTNILGGDSVKEIVTTGLADNLQEKSEGLSFVLEKDGSGLGMQMIFRKTKDTVGYSGSVGDRETYSALNVALDFFPITVQVRPAFN